MKINGLIKKARWENIPCQCGKEVMNSFPIKECLHCKFDQCWKSVPQKDFKVNDHIIDIKTGKITKKQTRTVKEITLVRGSFEDVIGWTF
jgi:hypothetical protein